VKERKSEKLTGYKLLAPERLRQFIVLKICQRVKPGNHRVEKECFGYKYEKGNANIPLRNFVRCSACETPFMGYILKKKNLYYYKCNRIGDPLKEQFLNICKIPNELENSASKAIEQNLQELIPNLISSKKRFALREMDSLEIISNPLIFEFLEITPTDKLQEARFPGGVPSDHAKSTIIEFSKSTRFLL
jgi:hypothetical protein